MPLRPGVVKTVIDLDEHVEGHHVPKRVLAALVIDDVFDGDEAASRGKRIVDFVKGAVIRLLRFRTVLKSTFLDRAAA